MRKDSIYQGLRLQVNEYFITEKLNKTVILINVGLFLILEPGKKSCFNWLLSSNLLKLMLYFIYS